MTADGRGPDARFVLRLRVICEEIAHAVGLLDGLSYDLDAWAIPEVEKATAGFRVETRRLYKAYLRELSLLGPAVRADVTERWGSEVGTHFEDYED